jgi:nicotinamidase-related amidase
MTAQFPPAEESVLVVIDAQIDEVDAEDAPIIAAIADRLRLAREQRRHVFFVEMRHRNNPTVPGLLKLVEGYDRCQVFWKEESDGSDEIFEALEILELSARTFILCGFFSSCCVFFTALGLWKEGCNVTVDQDCCSNEETAWCKYRDFPGIQLMRSLSAEGVTTT